MNGFPYTVLSCCVSLDGYLDDATTMRLRLSNDADLARVDALRATCDAILVGATTLRRDDPRLLVRDAGLRRARVLAGLSASPIRVAVTRTGLLDPHGRLFTSGAGDRVIYCAGPAAAEARRRLGEAATVVATGERPSMADVVADLAERGVRRLLVEGGGSVLTQFLTAGLVDELQLAVAPLFVGDGRGARFVEDGRFPWTASRRAELVSARAVGDVAVLRYALSERFRDGSAAGVEVERSAPGGVASPVAG